jgi:inner membrane protein
LTHPLLDWVNSYGMRWWVPLHPDWSYGDALFIVDPWLWLLLGGAAFLLHPGGRRGQLGWALLAGALTLLILGSEVAPPTARVVWALGVLGWIGLGWMSRQGGMAPPRVARWAVVAACAYLALMVGQASAAERITRNELQARGLVPLEALMVGPVPARPLRGEIIARTPEGYHRGEFSWTGPSRVQMDPLPIRTHPRDRIVVAAEAHPELRRYLVWARFPRYQVRETSDGWEVEVTDLRYSASGARGGLSGLTVSLDPELHPREALH